MGAQIGYSPGLRVRVACFHYDHAGGAVSVDMLEMHTVLHEAT